IHDDASTDKTGEIIEVYARRYPNIIIPILEQENQYSKRDGSILRITRPFLKGKYLAFCEGDDYWIDPHKLQKQVDFLEENPEYVLCYTNFNILYQKSGKMEKDLIKAHPDRFKKQYTLDQWLICRGYTAPMTWVFRKETFDDYESIPSCDGTFVQFAHFLHEGKVKCLEDDTTAVYRALAESASHSSNPHVYYNRIKNLRHVQKVLAKKYNMEEEVEYQIDVKYFSHVYRLICLVGTKQERDELALYCTGFLQKVVLCLSDNVVAKKVMCWIYKHKHR
ncbi:MAG TPA: glycosyltransferase, partial [Methanocorpusculum sp.]|nr:glycosyltransferase [Methanocorpusculum sp.]